MVFTRVSKSNWLFIITLHGWLKKLASLSPPIKTKTKITVTRPHAFSRASHQLQVITLCFDSPGLSAPFMIGQNDMITCVLAYNDTQLETGLVVTVCYHSAH